MADQRLCFDDEESEEQKKEEDLGMEAACFVERKASNAMYDTFSVIKRDPVNKNDQQKRRIRK